MSYCGRNCTIGDMRSPQKGDCSRAQSVNHYGVCANETREVGPDICLKVYVAVLSLECRSKS
jgi:hypothetical protein